MADVLAPIVYPEETQRSGEEYWRRFLGEPDFTGLTVLDLGCGSGAMAIRIAEKGAGQVVGVDLNESAIVKANTYLGKGHPELAGRVEFQSHDVAVFGDDRRFDIIVSKDTFEHVEDLGGLLAELHGLLKPGGRLYAGFSPLYYSPFGDHGRTKLGVPWAHAVLPSALTFRWASRLTQKDVRSLLDLGLNGWTPAQFRDAFEGSPFTIESISYNQGNKPLLKALSRARTFGPVEKFCTVSIYAILRRAS